MQERDEVKNNVKKDVKKTSFDMAIFNKIKQGLYPSEIARRLGISRQKVDYHIKKLKILGLIDKHSKKNWFVHVKTFSLGTRPTTNLHALQINIPILSGEIKGSDWEVKEELRNWTPKYKKFSQLGGLTIKNNNNKSISIFAHSRDLKEVKEVDELAFDIRNWALETFRDTFNVTLDIINAETKSLHLATEDKHSEDMQKKGEKFELDLDKKAEKVFPKDKIDAKAWIDGSPFSFTAETNDKEWKRAYLSMPFTLREIREMAAYSVKFYSGHVGIVEKLNKILEEPKVKRHIRKKTNQDQTKLGDFL